MADIDDRWFKTVKHPDGTAERVPTDRHGIGKRWLARWRDGERQRKRSFDRKADAESFIAQVRADLDRGTYIDPSAGKTTLRAYGQQWRAGLTTDPATLMQLDSRLNVWVYPKIGDVPLGLLAKRPSLIQQWIKSMEADLGASTIKGIVGWVSTIFNAAVEDGIVSRNPCAARSVRPPKATPKKVVPWNLVQVISAADALPGRYSAMVYLGAGCGHRQGELFGVSLDDVDFLGRIVHVRRQVRIINGHLVFSPPKGGKERAVPLPETVGLRLSAHITAHPPANVTLPWKAPGGEPVTANLLFTTAGGKALNRNDFNRLWRPARKAAGVPDTRDNGCHVLRHTAASAWLAAGVDVRTVAEHLGHADPSFTLNVYSHLMPDAADRARRAMDAFFRGANEPSGAPDVPQAGG